MKPNQGKQFLRDQRQHPDDMSHASPSDMARCVQTVSSVRGIGGGKPAVRSIG